MYFSLKLSTFLWSSDASLQMLPSQLVTLVRFSTTWKEAELHKKLVKDLITVRGCWLNELSVSLPSFCNTHYCEFLEHDQWLEALKMHINKNPITLTGSQLVIYCIVILQKLWHVIHIYSVESSWIGQIGVLLIGPLGAARWGWRTSWPRARWYKRLAIGLVSGFEQGMWSWICRAKKLNLFNPVLQRFHR